MSNLFSFVRNSAKVKEATFDNELHICFEVSAASVAVHVLDHIHSINEGAFQPLHTPLRFGNAVLFLKRGFVISIFRITEPTGVCVLSSFKCFS